MCVHWEHCGNIPITETPQSQKHPNPCLPSAYPNPRSAAAPAQELKHTEPEGARKCGTERADGAQHPTLVPWLPPAPQPSAAPSFPPSLPTPGLVGARPPSPEPPSARSCLLPSRSSRPSRGCCRCQSGLQPGTAPAGARFPGDPGRQRASPPRPAALPAAAAAVSGPAAESPQRTRTCGDSSKCAQRQAAAPAGFLPGWRRALPPPRGCGHGRGATRWPVPVDVTLSPALGKHVGTRLLTAVGRGAGWGQPLLRNCPPPHTPTCHPCDLPPPGPP